MTLAPNDAFVRLSSGRRGIDRLPRIARARRGRKNGWPAGAGRDAAMRMTPGNERVAIVRAARFVAHARRRRVFDEPWRV
jgi:hypothetical protein